MICACGHEDSRHEYIYDDKACKVFGSCEVLPCECQEFHENIDEDMDEID